tara:strand:- start:276 stop:461 length:186 start_codon:yes stop_codon:yes gene_type:complete
LPKRTCTRPKAPPPPPPAVAAAIARRASQPTPKSDNELDESVEEYIHLLVINTPRRQYALL